MEAKTHIALVSIPVLSHQVSLLEFAKQLIHLYKNSFHVTCIIPTISNSPSIASKPFFDTLPSSIQCIFLPPINFEDLKNEIMLESQVQISVSRSMPYVFETLRSFSTNSNLVALVIDPFAHEAHKFAKELNILSYTYFPCSAMVLSMCLYFSKLDKMITCEYKDHPTPIEIPGCISLDGKDLPDSAQERSSLAYNLFHQRSQQLHQADGIIINSFLELESETFKAMSQDGPYGTSTIPNVYAVGPIVQTKPNIQNQACECLLWLDNQPPNSVIYISFGSGGTHSHDQINELALGLELSKYKFLWVNVRPPNNKASASYLSNDEVDPLNFLPLGFLERTKGQGFVMCGWAPQVEVLKHDAIGAFLTHCGWNSSLESIVHGVPMIAWPLFAEQRSNAELVTNGLRIAMRPKCDSKGIVVKEEVVNVIKGVMESEEIEGRVKELQKFANCAMMEDGSSMKTLSMLALKWKSLGKSM
ncbi:unnamed protein product [Lathyrus sativus]|nr:unnamed protein product [Lathyrus sativus]